mgnify:CR=1 FL=1
MKSLPTLYISLLNQPELLRFSHSGTSNLSPTSFISILILSLLDINCVDVTITEDFTRGCVLVGFLHTNAHNLSTILFYPLYFTIFKELFCTIKSIGE